MINHRRILNVHRRLVRRYGPRPTKLRQSAVEVLVGTILSQSTSKANSSAGYRGLRRTFRTWDQVAAAPVERIERSIRIAGLSRQKAPRIKAILQDLKATRGKIDLQFLKELPADEAVNILLAMPGVGPKTARCTLLFAFGSTVFPVDTHIHRIAIRLGWLPARSTADDAHETLTARIPPPLRYEMHVLLIEHGRQTCTARSPKCSECPLRRVCAYGRE